MIKNVGRLCIVEKNLCRMLEYNLDSVCFQERPSPSMRIKETCTLNMGMDSDYGLHNLQHRINEKIDAL